VNAPTDERRRELDRLQAQIASRASIVHLAHGAVATLLALMVYGLAGLFEWGKEARDKIEYAPTVALAASASLASGLPFLIVRKEAKGYGTDNRLEGVAEDGELVCLVEDVVTSGGAAVAAVEALREAGLSVGTAVCVVDREEGGADELARAGVRLRPLFRAAELLDKPKSAAKPHG